MLSRRSTLAAIALAAACIATVTVQERRVTAAQERAAELALKVTNDSAAHDSTRRLESSQLRKAIGDTVAVFQKLVVQVAQRGDAVDRALSLERRGRYELGVRVDSLLRASQAGSPVVEDTRTRIRRASFNIRQAPYTVAAAVEIPPAPDTSRVDLRIALDPIPVVARLSCAAPNADGIRAASIEAQSPRWASVRIDKVEQSPDLCASPALSRGRRWIAFRPILIGGGKVILPDGTARWGGFVGTGLSIGGS